MIRTLALLALGSSAIALAGCGPNVHFGPAVDVKSRGAMKVISKLTCPKEQGDLTLVLAAPDGLSCQYKGEDSEVTLRLVALNGDTPRSALTPIETELKALMPEMKTPANTEDVSGSDDEQTVDLPGVHIRAGDHGAKVRVAGVNIDANDDSSEIRIERNTGGDADDTHKTVSIHSGDTGNVEVAADNDGDSRQDRRERRRRRRDGDNVTALYMLASDKPTSGYRLVGYNAGGPKNGPLAVAIVKSKSSEDDEHHVFSDAKALVRVNVGGDRSHITID
ncbi:MAG: hypothetical protein JWP35_3286 [Caulobacter sp.]|nr:hypothetical protein [Caulobacter sp.]